MPIPVPNDSEDRSAFMERCMGNETMRDEFPDTDQRRAVCEAQWDDSEAKAMHRTKYLDAPLHIKQLSEDGTFEGYGSVFGNEDAYGEIVARGAFEETLRQRGPEGVAMLWQHNAREPIGVYEEIREDETGLWMKGRLALQTQRGREAYELMKMRAVTGLSIGFVPQQVEIDEQNETVTLTRVDLWETSIVTFPANDAARVSAVKTFGAGETPEPKVLERALRHELGMSKQQARAFMADGYQGLSDPGETPDGGEGRQGSTSRRDAVDGDALEAVSNLLTKLQTYSEEKTR